ncbi:anion permease [Thalassomonas viridans]|uniref:Anion permease n=1 Tax=Thalassomonas viridans TaxID=137584 RepID=A0AAE9Z189_9GAMM|nr:SLC13 family permease [Thalassomonas viridans]WDE04372.1 anion permease [Thalassomonas viridans]
MTSINQELLTTLTTAPILDRLSRADMARLLPYVELKELAPGEVLYHPNDVADTLYYILDGELTLHSSMPSDISLDHGYLGEELLLNRATYTGGAKAEDNGCRLLAFHGEDAKRLLSQDSTMIDLFLASYTRHHDQEPWEVDLESKAGKTGKKGFITLLGWLLVFTVPVLLYFLTAPLEISENARTFISVFLVSIFMWAFKLVPDYVAGMLSILVVLVLGITPSDVVLSGFQSSGFFMAMSIFVLAVVIVDSGLVYRLSLLLLKLTPCSTFFYNLMLTLIGLLFTPILPSANGRVGLISPLLKDLLSSLKFTGQGRDATRMALSAFFGVSLFSSIFLTSKAINFLVFTMLPTQVQDSFQWSDWAQAASITGATLFVMFMLLSYLLFNTDKHPELDKSQIKLQLNILGNMSIREWGAVFGVLLLVAGIVTTSIHKIKPAWIGLAIMFIFLALGSLSKRSFREKIDWPFLFLLGTLIGLTRTLNYLGLDQLLANKLSGLQQMMTDNFYLFVLVLFGVILVLRTALSTIATIVIASSVFLPLANIAGVNMWVVGFIILTLSEAFLLPYQNTYYLLFRGINSPQPLYHEGAFLRFNIWMTLFRLFAVYASIPVWRAMEIL